MHAMAGLATMTGTTPMADPAMLHLVGPVKSMELITGAPADIGGHLIDHITGHILIRGMDRTIERGPDITTHRHRYISIRPLRHYTHHHRR